MLEALTGPVVADSCGADEHVTCWMESHARVEHLAVPFEDPLERHVIGGRCERGESRFGEIMCQPNSSASAILVILIGVITLSCLMRARISSSSRRSIACSEYVVRSSGVGPTANFPTARCEKQIQRKPT